MRGRLLAWLVAAACALALAVTFSGCTTILGSFDVAPDGPATGTVCDAGSQCATGFCSDGVCCEATCDGVCEACNIPGSVGKCAPIPDGENPANECPTTPLPPAAEEDAGAPVDLDAGDPGDAGDAGEADASVTFAPPDAGISANDGQCGGVCNGNRACRFPGRDRTCGSTFCTTPTEQARAACDGAGHCVVGSEECAAYSCSDGSAGCKQSCTGEADCAPTHFCDAATSTCKPKLGNGSACTSVAQCQESHCVTGVCCNDSCTGFPGASCTVPGNVGQCRCDACPNGACQLFYIDRDGDGFGDKNATVQNGFAIPACASAPPPTGYSATNDDCYDEGGPATATARLVFPGQTQFFAFAYQPAGGAASFDYNCDGQTTKETPEYTNGETCGFCRPGTKLLLCGKTTTCSTEGENAGFACSTGFCPIRGCTTSRCATVGTDAAFTSTVSCGVRTAATNCGSCSGGAMTGATTSQVTQQCR